MSFMVDRHSEGTKPPAPGHAPVEQTLPEGEIYARARCSKCERWATFEVPRRLMDAAFSRGKDAVTARLCDKIYMLEHALAEARSENP